MKSQPTCPSMANRVGSAYCTGSAPGRDLRAHQDTDDLGDRGAGPEDG